MRFLMTLCQYGLKFEINSTLFYPWNEGETTRPPFGINVLVYLSLILLFWQLK